MKEQKVNLHQHFRYSPFAAIVIEGADDVRLSLRALLQFWSFKIRNKAVSHDVSELHQFPGSKFFFEALKLGKGSSWSECCVWWTRTCSLILWVYFVAAAHWRPPPTWHPCPPQTLMANSSRFWKYNKKIPTRSCFHKTNNNYFYWLTDWLCSIV